MYIPKHYKGRGKEEAVAFMNKFNFATIISVIDSVPVATHLPFIISEKQGTLFLTSHFARANEHWKHIKSNVSLVIFTEPHAYVSPKHYDKKENVPTWNYISVHAYGKARLIEKEAEIAGVLEAMINSFEPEYGGQWDALPEEYKARMSRGIVAFEIEVSELQYKDKLSQNKKGSERRSIINAFSRSENTNEKNIAKYMELNEERATKSKEE